MIESIDTESDRCKYCHGIEKKNLEDENIRAITSVNEEENLYQTRSKFKYDFKKL